MTLWRWRIWCRNCYGEDPMGCFNGSFELSDETYETKEEADAAGRAATLRSIYEYEVVAAQRAGEGGKAGT